MVTSATTAEGTYSIQFHFDPDQGDHPLVVRRRRPARWRRTTGVPAHASCRTPSQ